MNPTFGSAFAGIGGLDRGLERAGWKCRWQIEIDPYCRKVLKKHWPHVPRWPDIRTVEYRSQVDLISAGFPCQDLSVAGKRRGIRGERSGLFFDIMRLVRLVRPRFVLLENVPGLLSRSEWMGAVLGELAESGYDAEWDCIPAAAVGAPHIRDRVFIIAYDRDAYGLGFKNDPKQKVQEGPDSDASGNGDASHAGAIDGVLQSKSSESEDSIFALRDGAPRDLADTEEPGLENKRQPREPTDAREANRRTAFTGLERCRSSWWEVESGICRVADGTPNRIHRLRGLGNAVVPQVAEWLGRRILEAWKR